MRQTRTNFILPATALAVGKAGIARISGLTSGLCACLCLALSGGCYEHVVGVRGPASANYDVQEANIGEGESMWATESPRPVEGNRYSGTTLDRAKPVPVKPQKKTD